MQRRLSLLVVAVMVAVMVGVAVARAQIGRSPLPPGAEAPTALQVYEGVSNQGDIQEALDDAVARALRALPGADRMVRYRVREIAGEQGGIRGATVVRVAIEVTGEAPRLPERGPGTGVERPAEPHAEVLRRAVQAELKMSGDAVDRGDSVELELTVKNSSARAVRIPFATQQKYDFEVWRDNRLVWRWSQGKQFAQSITAVVLQPGGTATYRTNWELRNNAGMYVPAGRYQVRAFLRTGVPELRIGASAPLTVTGR